MSTINNTNHTALQCIACDKEIERDSREHDECMLVNKGDDLHPNYRSRVVARQLKAHDKSGESFFAPTPPLEALRTVFSIATTTMPGHRPCGDPSSEQRVQVSFVDVSRAYFNAKVDQSEAHCPQRTRIPIRCARGY